LIDWELSKNVKKDVDVTRKSKATFTSGMFPIALTSFILQVNRMLLTFRAHGSSYLLRG